MDKRQTNIRDSLKQNGYEFSTSHLNSAMNVGNSQTAMSFDNWSYEGVKAVVQNPLEYGIDAKNLSRLAYDLEGIYSNTIDYMVAIPTLQNMLFPRNKDKKYKLIRDEMKPVTKVLNLNKTTRDILRTAFIDGIYCGYLVETLPNTAQINLALGKTSQGDTVDSKLKKLTVLFDKIKENLHSKFSLKSNFMIVPLNTDYCQVVDVKNNYNVIAFDLTFFDQLADETKKLVFKTLPIELAKAYNEYKNGNSTSTQFILDYRKTVVLKGKSSIREPGGRPLGLSALLDMKLSETYNDSQYKLITELASSIYYLTMPEGEKQGRCAITRTQQDQLTDSFVSAIRANTSGDVAKISTLTLPPNAEIGRLKKDSALIKDPLYDQNAKKISTSLGFASGALNASSEGGASYSSLQVNIDLVSSQIFQYLDEIAVEYTKVLSEWAGINNPFNYIDFTYLPISWLNKDNFFDKMSALYLTQGGNRSLCVAATGVDPDDYFSITDEENAAGLDDKYKPHATSYTFSDSADKPNPQGNYGINLGGREPVNDEDLTPAGAKTRNLNSNKMVKPSKK